MNERLNRGRERAVNALFTLALLAFLTYGSFENNNPAIEVALAQEEPTPTPTLIGDIPTLGPEYRVYNSLIAKNYKQPTPTATPVLPPPITEPPASPTLCPPDACETPTPTLEAPSNK